MDMRFGTCNVRSLYREGSLKTTASKLKKYSSDLVTVQEVGWDNDSSEPVDNCIFFYGNGNANHYLVKVSFVHKGIR
jgi:hypothetical protein